MRTRDEHIEWCKQRARECCERGDMLGALHSMGRDLQKHPDTARRPWTQLWEQSKTHHNVNSKADVLKFIDEYIGWATLPVREPNPSAVSDQT